MWDISCAQMDTKHRRQILPMREAEKLRQSSSVMDLMMVRHDGFRKGRHSQTFAPLTLYFPFINFSRAPSLFVPLPQPRPFSFQLSLTQVA